MSDQTSASAFGWVKRHFPLIVGTAAVVLCVFGIILMFDQLARLSADLQRILIDTNLEWLVKLG